MSKTCAIIDFFCVSVDRELGTFFKNFVKENEAAVWSNVASPHYRD